MLEKNFKGILDWGTSHDDNITGRFIRNAAILKIILEKQRCHLTMV